MANGSHPAFEAKLLDEIRKLLIKQLQSHDELRKLLVDFRHDMMWIRKWAAELDGRLKSLEASSVDMATKD